MMVPHKLKLKKINPIELQKVQHKSKCCQLPLVEPIIRHWQSTPGQDLHFSSSLSTHNLTQDAFKEKVKEEKDERTK